MYISRYTIDIYSRLYAYTYTHTLRYTHESGCVLWHRPGNIRRAATRTRL